MSEQTDHEALAAELRERANEVAEQVRLLEEAKRVSQATMRTVVGPGRRDDAPTFVWSRALYRARKLAEEFGASASEERQGKEHDP